MNDTLRYEIKAGTFYRMTGYMAPGKDSPPDVDLSIEMREILWDLWWKLHGDTITAVLDAFDKEVR